MGDRKITMLMAMLGGEDGWRMQPISMPKAGNLGRYSSSNMTKVFYKRDTQGRKI